MFAPSGMSGALTAFLGHSRIPVNGTKFVEGLVMLKSKHYTSAALIALLASISMPSVKAQEAPATGAAVSTDGSMTSNAGMEQINQALEALTAELMTSLPPMGTYAVKSANDTTSGVPEDLLTQMTSSLQSSLMLASDFQMNLIDQAQLNAAWSNAIEFNGADFEKLVENTNFDALIVMNTRATTNGIELSLQAIGATEANSGQVISSSKVLSLKLDWKQLEGVDVAGVNSELALLRYEIEELKKAGRQVSQPQTFAEFYSNAELQNESGNTDAAINSYIKAIELQGKYYDVLAKVLNVAIVRYGVENARSLYVKRLEGKIPAEMKPFAELTLSSEYPLFDSCDLDNVETEHDCKIGPFLENSPPTLALWLKTQGRTLAMLRQRRQIGLELGLVYDYILLESLRSVIDSYEEGSFAENFLSEKDATNLSNIDELRTLEFELNRFQFSVNKVTGYSPGTGSVNMVYGKTEGEYELTPAPHIGGLPWYEADRRYFSEVDMAHLGSGEYSLKRMGPCNTSIGPGPRLNGFYTSPGDPSYEFWNDIIVSNADPLAKIRDYQTLAQLIETQGYGYAKYDDWRKIDRLPLLSAPNRTAFADTCIYSEIMSYYSTVTKKFDTNYATDTSRKFIPTVDKKTSEITFEFSKVAALIITDNVDITKPVYVMASDLGPVTDVSRDGSYIDPLGAYLFYGLGGGYPENFKNSWLYIPGTVEGLVGMSCISEVRYTDTGGRERSVKNGQRRKQFGSDQDNCDLPEATSGLNLTELEPPYKGGLVDDKSRSKVLEALAMVGYGTINAPSKVPGTAQPAITSEDTAIETAFGKLSEEQRKLVQSILEAQGYYQGSPDGQFGAKTKKALIEMIEAMVEVGLIDDGAEADKAESLFFHMLETDMFFSEE